MTFIVGAGWSENNYSYYIIHEAISETFIIYVQGFKLAVAFKYSNYVKVGCYNGVLLNVYINEKFHL